MNELLASFDNGNVIFSYLQLMLQYIVLAYLYISYNVNSWVWSANHQSLIISLLSDYTVELGIPISTASEKQVCFPTWAELPLQT